MFRSIYSSRFISISIGIIFLGLLLSSIYSSMQTEHQHLGTYFMYLWKYNSGLVLLLSTLLIIVITLMITLIANNYDITRVYTLIGGAYYLTAMLLMRSDDMQVWVIMTHVIILILLMLLLSTESVRDKLSLKFYSGVLVGVLVMFFPPFVLVLPAYLIASNLHAPMRIRGVLLMLGGTLLTLVYLVSYLYLTDKLQLWQQYLPDFNISFNYGPLTGVVVLFFVLMLFFYLRDLNRFRNKYNWQAQQKRLTLLYLGLGILLSTLLTPGYRPDILMANAPMLSLMMLTYYVDNKASGFASFILILFVILALSFYYIV